MDASTIGFLKADRLRLRILETLKSKSALTPQQVSHRLRIPPRQTESTLKELLGKSLVKEDKKGYFVTDEGIKILAQVSRAGM
ncbi:MAG: hypothetical protein V3R86_04670 [Candidatus Hydrothermarchaeaceae archaeon]